jgi:acyl carrier protein
LSGAYAKDDSLETAINTYISQEIVTKSEQLPLKNNTLLLESGILDSLSLLKLVLFLEKKFGVVVGPEELVPENFKTVDEVCSYLRAKRQK